MQVVLAYLCVNLKSACAPLQKVEKIVIAEVTVRTFEMDEYKIGFVMYIY